MARAMRFGSASATAPPYRPSNVGGTSAATPTSEASIVEPLLRVTATRAPYFSASRAPSDRNVDANRYWNRRLRAIDGSGRKSQRNRKTCCSPPLTKSPTLRSRLREAPPPYPRHTRLARARRLRIARSIGHRAIVLSRVASTAGAAVRDGWSRDGSARFRVLCKGISEALGETPNPPAEALRLLRFRLRARLTESRGITAPWSNPAGRYDRQFSCHLDAGAPAWVSVDRLPHTKRRGPRDAIPSGSSAVDVRYVNCSSGSSISIGASQPEHAGESAAFRWLHAAQRSGSGSAPARRSATYCRASAFVSSSSLIVTSRMSVTVLYRRIRPFLSMYQIAFDLSGSLPGTLFRRVARPLVDQLDRPEARRRRAALHHHDVASTDRAAHPS